MGYPVKSTSAEGAGRQMANTSGGMSNENYKKERETITGHYTDVLVKEDGRWLFIAWAGG